MTHYLHFVYNVYFVNIVANYHKLTLVTLLVFFSWQN